MAFPLGRIIIAAALFGALGASASFAARDASEPVSRLSAAEILEQFNLVTFTYLVTNAQLQARAFIGGNLAGESATFYGHSRALPPSD